MSGRSPAYANMTPLKIAEQRDRDEQRREPRVPGEANDVRFGGFRLLGAYSGVYLPSKSLLYQ